MLDLHLKDRSLFKLRSGLALWTGAARSMAAALGALRPLAGFRACIQQLSSGAPSLPLRPSTSAAIFSDFILSRHLPILFPLAIRLSFPSLGSIWEAVLRAVPKKKTSHRKKRQRFLAGKALKDVTETNRCSACGNIKRMHLLCPYCVRGKDCIGRV